MARLFQVLHCIVKLLSESWSIRHRYSTSPSWFPNISLRNSFFMDVGNPRSFSYPSLFCLKWREHRRNTAYFRTLLNLYKGFSPSVSHAKMHSRFGFSDPRHGQSWLVWTSLRWCISRGPMKTGLSPVSWCTSFKLRYVVVVRHVFSENVESGISAKYSEFLLVSAEWFHLFKLAWMSQDTCALRMDLNSTYEFRIPSPFLLPFGLFKEDP